MLPWSHGIRPDIMRSSVVLPHPDVPINEMNSPSDALSEMSESTVKLSPVLPGRGYCFDTPRTSMRACETISTMWYYSFSPGRDMLAMLVQDARLLMFTDRHLRRPRCDSAAQYLQDRRTNHTDKRRADDNGKQLRGLKGISIVLNQPA